MDSNLNVDSKEISKFEKMAETWWDPEGSFKPLHQLNPLRLNYIDRLADGLFGKSVLDVGCGGGILAESMAKIGATVTGIDMGEEPLDVAKLHALESKVEISYLKSTAEQHALKHNNFYDVVTCMEMLEHVPEPLSVIKACSDMVKPNGMVFFSTINRNVKSYIQAILGAEYILKILPTGTHDFNKFIKPSELISLVEQSELISKDAVGISYNPLTSIFSYSKSLDVNYIVAAKKEL